MRLIEHESRSRFPKYKQHISGLEKHRANGPLLSAMSLLFCGMITFLFPPKLEANSHCGIRRAYSKWCYCSMFCGVATFQMFQIPCQTHQSPLSDEALTRYTNFEYEPLISGSDVGLATVPRSVCIPGSSTPRNSCTQHSISMMGWIPYHLSAHQYMRVSENGVTTGKRILQGTGFCSQRFFFVI